MKEKQFHTAGHIAPYGICHMLTHESRGELLSLLQRPQLDPHSHRKTFQVRFRLDWTEEKLNSQAHLARHGNVPRRRDLCSVNGSEIRPNGLLLINVWHRERKSGLSCKKTLWSSRANKDRWSRLMSSVSRIRQIRSPRSGRIKAVDPGRSTWTFLIYEQGYFRSLCLFVCLFGRGMRGESRGGVGALLAI